MENNTWNISRRIKLLDIPIVIYSTSAQNKAVQEMKDLGELFRLIA
jgi:hypothetical protein